MNIRKVTVNEATPIILDSGADMSVLPLEYMNVVFALGKKSVLRDAQGNIMPGGALREALVEMVDGAGNMVAIKETFALSNVAEPLLALGKLLKKGWKVEGHDGEVYLSFGEFNMAVQSRHNSLVTRATIRAVTSAGAVPVNVRTVTMTFDGMMGSMITVPGWHLSLDRRVPFLVVHNTKHFKDSYPQFNRNDFPFRSTVVQKGNIWEVVEVAECRQDEAEIEECEGQETTAIFFFHQNMEDVNGVGIIHTGAFLQPRLRERKDGGDRQREQQGFGWFGQTLEDGVYEVDDEEEEMGQQHEAVDDDPFRRQQAAQVGDEEVIEEIDIDGEKYTAKSSLRKLREGLRLYGLPKGRSKAQAWQRLFEHHRHFAETLGAELARREFERRKFAEGGDGVRPQSIPRLPTKSERQIHKLTHWPSEDWCMQCVAARGKAHPHRRKAEDELRMQAKSEFPVISMDHCFTRGLTEPTEADKEDLRLYGGDLRESAWKGGANINHYKFSLLAMDEIRGRQGLWMMKKQLRTPVLLEVRHLRQVLQWHQGQLLMTRFWRTSCKTSRRTTSTRLELTSLPNVVVRQWMRRFRARARH